MNECYRAFMLERTNVLSLIVVRDSTNIKQMEEHNDARRRLYAAIPNALHEGRHVHVTNH